MSSHYGRKIKISIFGQSHSEAIGVSIDGLPAGVGIDLDELRAFMRRRAPGQSGLATPRKEADEPEVLSGLVGGKTCGAPLAIIIRNTNTKSSDYDKLRDIPRPSHADYTAYVKYGGHNDVSGGGHFSGRLTAPLCAAGGIVMQMLRSFGYDIEICAHLVRVGDALGKGFDFASVSAEDFEKVRSNPLPTLDKNAAAHMTRAITEAKEKKDSVGGIIECAAIEVPEGLGDPMFDGMENRISSIVFGIPGVKGIEFGSGFDSAGRRGSQHNDSFYIDDKDGSKVKTRTNNSGGIQGGITNGMPLIFRVAFKPTPSIGIEQCSVSLSNKENTKLTIEGRHDPCIALRAVPCIEAAAAIAICDAYFDI